MTIPQAYELALQHHRAGQLAEAEGIFRQILSVQPTHADALHFVGVIAHQGGRHDTAVEWIGKAIAVSPASLHYYLNLGSALVAQGRPDDAVAAYRHALQFRPDYAEAHSGLGNALRERGELDEAIASFYRALQIKPDYPHAYSNLGNALRERGRLDEAIAACRRAIQLKPDFPAAHNNLGNALREKGHAEEAMAAFRRALQFDPNFPEAHNNLGNALRDRGQIEEAISEYGNALRLKPKFPMARNNLGNALRDQGQVDEAISEYRHAIELQPNYPDAYNNLGNALRERGQLVEAIAALRRAIELKPDFAGAHVNLGNALRERGDLDAAILACRRALQIGPDIPEAHNNLGSALREQGNLDDAIAVFHRALQLRAVFPEARTNLGNALRDLGRLDDAITAHRQALREKPDYPNAHNNLGVALSERGALDEAIAEFRQALQFKPDYPEALNNLGNELKNRGDLDEAIAAYRQALHLNPANALAHSNLVFTLHFQPRPDDALISEEHKRWNERFSAPLKPHVQPHTNERREERRLLVGYVSPDFRDHPVGRFVLPLLERHDLERFEILCYSGVVRSDWMTDRLRALKAQWRSTVGVPDERLAQMIREDGVDILVDLALHTAGNRLPMFTRQPAPVQVTWLGYPGGAGVQSIGYRFTDAYMDPPQKEAASPFEEPAPLSECWCCYDPVDETPEVTELPALSVKKVTFGSLNNFAKMNEGVLNLWVQVMDAVKESRLMIFCPEGRAREKVRAFFSARGIELDRLELVGKLPRLEYLRLYQRIDIGLDPFPCNGMTTTCDALWMGAPVLTLPGKEPVARAGLSLLSSIGLGEFAASSQEDFVRIAVELAGDLPRLTNLRFALRARMRASPLTDAPRFARNVEDAYRSMWRRWVRATS